MPRLLLVLLLMTTSAPFTFCQIEKGTVMVGGNAGFQFKANNQHIKEFAFSASPYAMYSVIKQLALGGQISYSFYHMKNNDPLLPNPKIEAGNSFSIGPAIRTNVFIGGKTFFFFHASPSFGIQSIKFPESSNKLTYSYSIVTWRVGPGVSVFATKNVAIEIGLFYDGMKQVESIKEDKILLAKLSPVITHGLTIAVGLQFYVHKKQKKPDNNLK